MSRNLKIIAVVALIVVLAGLSMYLIKSSGTPAAPAAPKTGVFPTTNEPTTPTSPTTLLPQSPGSNTSTGQTLAHSSRLAPISQQAVGGFIVFNDPTASSTVVRYVERPTGHIFEYLQETAENTRISNTTVPGIEEAVWSKTGDAVVLRYFEAKSNTLKSFLAHVTASTDLNATSSPPLSGKFLDDALLRIVTAPRERTAGERYVTLTQKGTDGLLDLEAFDSTNILRLLTLPTPEWHISWPASGMMVLTTSPSGTTDGYAYLYDVARAVGGQVRPEKILGPLSGLEAIGSPDGSKILYSITKEQGVSTSLFTIKNKLSAAIGIATFAEKCIFSLSGNALYCAVPSFLPSSLLPDSWYQGTTHFSDAIWRVDAQTGAATKIVFPETEVGAPIDAVDLQIDPAEQFLYFKDKTTGVLWQLKLN